MQWLGENSLPRVSSDTKSHQITISTFMYVHRGWVHICFLGIFGYVFPDQDIFIVTDAPQQPLQPVQLKDFIQGMISPDFSFSMPDENERKWMFIHCNADFTTAGNFNHWVPAVTAKSVGETLFKSLMHWQLCEAEVSVTTTQSRYLELDTKYQEAMRSDGDLETLESQLATSEALAENWKDFVVRCGKIEILPFQIPADGNCLLWSVRVLENEDFNESAWKPTEQNLAEVQELRNHLSRACDTLSTWS